MPRLLDSFDLVNHGCLIPQSAEHGWEAMAAWVADGLRIGERVLYFEDDSAHHLLERLEDDRVPAGRAIAEGQLIVVPGEVTRETATVPLDGVESVVHDAVAQARRQGWPGLRLVGEARARLGTGLDTLIDCETAVDRMLRRNPRIRLLCIYDHAVFGADAVTALRRLHPVEVRTSSIHDDRRLRVTDGPAGELRLAGELDYNDRHTLQRVLEILLARAFEAFGPREDVVLDISSLRFIDVDSVVRVARLAYQFPAGTRLVVRGARPHVRDVFDRVAQPVPARLALPDRWHDPRGATP